MGKEITIIDDRYDEWIDLLATRYQQSQVRAAVRVNSEVLSFYWELGRDIEQMQVEQRWGEGVLTQLSRDMRKKLPGIQGFSKSSIYYSRKFYNLYKDVPQIFHQAGGKSEEQIFQQPVGKIGEQIFQPAAGIFSIPWRHHCLIMDKAKGNTDKALFYVAQTLENGWSYSMLHNFIDSDLYERSGKALTNFQTRLPEVSSELAQELTRDPYDFAFTGITGRYNERLLKDALLQNITTFLTELGTGFAYVGKEYRLQIEEKERFIDLLFYNLKLSCYVVVEVKIGELDFQDVGQLGGYVVACNHLLRNAERDNPTIGILICKQAHRTVARYALESSSQPISVSEYDLERFYPEKVEGTIPTLAEIEHRLNQLK